MRLSSAEAFAPATIANLGIGFDILGAAVDGLGDTVRATLSETPGVRIQSITGDHGKLPLESHKNTAGIAAAVVLEQTQSAYGVSLEILKGLPLASGLGSSAASAVAAAAAVNAVLGSPLSLPDLLGACLEGEAAVSGYHADNVAPALFGGITLSFGLTADQIRTLPVPQNLFLTLATPDVEVPTALARAVLPQSVSLKSMVHQTSGVARLLQAIYAGDVRGMAEAMESDGVVEPARAHLMPMLAEARQAAKRAGALGLVISGAGPTLAAISDTLVAAEAACSALAEIYRDADIDCAVRVTRIAEQGVIVRL